MRKQGFPFGYGIDKGSPRPIYSQLVTAVIAAIHKGDLNKDQLLPSINTLSKHYAVSRSTIEKTYTELREMGHLGSHHGKGYFVTDRQQGLRRRVLFIFNAFNSYQKTIFDMFSKILDTDIVIEMEVYNSDPTRFQQLMQEKKDEYSHYIIIPQFYGDNTEAYRLINSLPKHKVVFLCEQTN